MVTDTVYLATEDIVWEALWDQARKLKKRQMEDLEREMGRKKQVTVYILGQCLLPAFAFAFAFAFAGLWAVRAEQNV